MHQTQSHNWGRGGQSIDEPSFKQLPLYLLLPTNPTLRNYTRRPPTQPQVFKSKQLPTEQNTVSIWDIATIHPPRNCSAKRRRSMKKSPSAKACWSPQNPRAPVDDKGKRPASRPVCYWWWWWYVCSGKKQTLCKGIKGNFSLGLDANNDEGESVVMRPRWVATKAVCEGAEGRKGGSFSSGQMCCGADLVASGLAHMEELELESASS